MFPLLRRRHWLAKPPKTLKSRLLEAGLSCTILCQEHQEIRVKITGVETYPVWGGERNYLFVVVDTDEDLYGVGEAGLTGRELAVTGTIEHFEPLLLGENPFRTEHLWQLLFRGGFFPARHAVSAAISAVDIALWDIKGKALGVPIYELLGGLSRDRIRLYGQAGSPDGAKAVLAEGYQSMKISVTTSRGRSSRYVENPDFV